MTLTGPCNGIVIDLRGGGTPSQKKRNTVIYAISCQRLGSDTHKSLTFRITCRSSLPMPPSGRLHEILYYDIVTEGYDNLVSWQAAKPSRSAGDTAGGWASYEESPSKTNSNRYRYKFCWNTAHSTAHPSTCHRHSLNYVSASIVFDASYLVVASRERQLLEQPQDSGYIGISATVDFTLAPRVAIFNISGNRLSSDNFDAIDS